MMRLSSLDPQNREDSPSEIYGPFMQKRENNLPIFGQFCRTWERMAARGVISLLAPFCQRKETLKTWCYSQPQGLSGRHNDGLPNRTRWLLPTGSGILSTGKADGIDQRFTPEQLKRIDHKTEDESIWQLQERLDRLEQDYENIVE